MFETTVTVVGNVIATPVRRVINEDTSVTSFRIASTARRFDRQSGEWQDGDVLYLKVTCWRALGDNVTRSLVQGDPVIVVGRLATREYEVDGQRRSAYELTAQSVGHDLSKGQTDFSRGVRPGDLPPMWEAANSDELAPSGAAGSDQQPGFEEHELDVA